MSLSSLNKTNKQVTIFSGEEEKENNFYDIIYSKSCLKDKCF